MNTARETHTADRSDPRIFDRLADGELDEAARRALLQSLDDVPDGWKRCALAFLEAQAWRESLRDLGQEAPPLASPVATAAACPPAAAVPPTAARSPQRSAAPWLGTVLAMAASFLLALGLGTFWRGGNPRPPAEKSAPALSPDTVHLAGQPPASTGQPASPLSVAPDEMWLTSGPAQQGVPPEVLRVLRRAGYELRTDRRFVPVEIEQGQPMLVPVEAVEFYHTGNVYQ